MDALKYRKNLVFTNRVMGDTVFMLLDKGIGHDDNNPFIYGSAFAEEMYYWKAQGKKITVKINCLGGSVYDGWSMIDAIIQTGANTENVGVAASMGGICLLFGKHRTAYDYSTCMIHAPHGGNPEFLEVVRAQFKSLLETRTKFSQEEIKDMMTSGRDYFFNAHEMLEKGIVDEVIKTGKKPVGMLVINQASLTHAYAACNKVLQEKSINMENLFAKLFGKTTEEDSIVAAIKMKADNEALTAKVLQMETEATALKSKIRELEDVKKVDENKVKAEKLIADNSAKLQGLNDEAKAKLIDDAIANYDMMKRVIDALPAVSAKSTSAAAVINADKTTALTYEVLAKTNPKMLAEIAENDPELYARLELEYIEKNKK